jgi:uncharacterized protein (TIGR03083 family)
MSDAAPTSFDLPFDPHEHLRTDGVEFIDIVATHGFDHAVPSCPDWNLGDLAWHVGTVWNRWARIVSQGLTTAEEVEAIGQPARPAGDLLLDWVTAAHTALYSALARASDATEVWTWTGSRQPEVWVERRMAHETAVHRWDASHAVGVPFDIATELAADGIDEFLTLFVARDVAEGTAPLGGTVHLHCTDPRLPDGSGEWLVTELDAAGARFSKEHAKGDVAVRGRASDLLLWLWGRDAGPVEMFGDTDLAETFRTYGRR